MKMLGRSLSVLTLFIAVFAPQAEAMAYLASLGRTLNRGMAITSSVKSFKDLVAQASHHASIGKATPTESMLAVNSLQVKIMLTTDSEGDRTSFDEDAVVKVSEKIINLERPLQDNYYTFIHGRQWGHHMPEKVYRMFEEFWVGKAITDFRYLAPFGTISMHDKIFINANLFDNSTLRSSNALWYLLQDFNQNNVRSSIEKSCMSYPQIYKKYESELKSLDGACNQLTPYGELMLFAVPKDKVAQYITYLSTKGERTPAVTIDGKSTQDVKIIVDAKRKDSMLYEGEINFAAPLMTINEGMKIFSVNAIDDERYAQWEKQFNDVKEKIAKDAQPRIDALKAMIAQQEASGELEQFRMDKAPQ